MGKRIHVATASLAGLAGLVGLAGLAGLDLFAVGGVVQSDNNKDAVSVNVKVTYIANEGFLLRSEGSTVLIDALHRGEIEMYAKPSERTLHDLESAVGEFASVDLILVSHYHRDHFKAESVASHMSANPGARLISSPQVVEEVRRAASKEINSDSAYPMTPGRAKFRLADVDLELFRLSHGSGRFAKIQNLGQIFVVGGIKFLHIGDAEIIAENFSVHKLAKNRIDYAFIPYWFLTDAEGRRIVNEIIRPRRVIAMHIPPAEMEVERKKILAAYPGAIIFATRNESRTLSQ